MKSFRAYSVISILSAIFMFSSWSCSTVQRDVRSVETAVLKDCPDCPELVIIPAGTFIMGSPETEEGRDPGENQHPVTITKGFALAKYLVTKGEFRQFVDETGYDAMGTCFSIDAEGNPEESERYTWETPGFDQTDDEPVACVNAEDAEAYVSWLSKKTGKNYRLPTEAEFEYAARAGTVTARYWGESQDDGCAYANGIGYESKDVFYGMMSKCDDGFVYTSPVGTYKPNAFGLYDMLGNAWIWLADCWYDDYSDGPDNEEARTEQGCAERVMRGGSYISNYISLRASSRHKAEAERRFHNYGIRVARDLEPGE